jgi:hypothetical protein
MNYTIKFIAGRVQPPLWSSGPNSSLQIQRVRDHSRRYKVFWELLSLERVPLSLMRIIVILRNCVSGMLRRVALVQTDVSEELSASFIRVTRIGELRTKLAVTRNRRTLRRRRRQVPPKRLFLQEPHGVTSQKTPFFLVTAVKTSNLTYCYFVFVSKEEAVVYFESLYHCSPRGREEIHEEPQRDNPVPGQKLEPLISKIQFRIIATETNPLHELLSST